MHTTLLVEANTKNVPALEGQFLQNEGSTVIRVTTPEEALAALDCPEKLIHQVCIEGQAWTPRQARERLGG